MKLVIYILGLVINLVMAVLLLAAFRLRNWLLVAIIISVALYSEAAMFGALAGCEEKKG